MSALHRTQVLIDERHYRALKRRAHEEGLSLSALIRQILDAHLDDADNGDPGPQVQDLAGIGSDSDVHGRDHDQALYGTPP